MRQFFRRPVFALALLCAACGDVHTPGEDIIAPTVVVVVPARIVTSVLYGIGNGAGRVFLTLHVQGSRGEPAPHVLTTINVTGTATITASQDLSVVPSDQSLTLDTDSLGQIQITVAGRGTVPVAMSAGLIGSIVVLSIP